MQSGCMSPNGCMGMPMTGMGMPGMVGILAHKSSCKVFFALHGKLKMTTAMKVESFG